MNIYIVEDNDDDLLAIKRNVEDAINRVQGDWTGRYTEVVTYEIFTPDFHIGDLQSEIDETKVLNIFQDGPPHVIILDWDLTWKGHVEMPGDEIVRIIDKNTNSIGWNPYIIFTSAMSPKALLNILGGKDLKRIFPTSFMLLEKEYLTESSRKLRHFKVVKDAIKQALEYASLNNIELDVFPFPQTEMYSPYLSIDEFGNEKWKTKTAPFTHTYWVDKDKEKIKNETKYVQNILIKNENLIAVLAGVGDSHAVILWSEATSKHSLVLLLCSFPSGVRKNYFIKRFPFLEESPGVYYNKNGVHKNGTTLNLDPQKFGEENVDELLLQISNHNRFAKEELEGMEQSRHDSEKIKEHSINRLYNAFNRFLG